MITATMVAAAIRIAERRWAGADATIAATANPAHQAPTPNVSAMPYTPTARQHRLYECPGMSLERAGSMASRPAGPDDAGPVGSALARARVGPLTA
jgi:hypothetical protein